MYSRHTRLFRLYLLYTAALSISVFAAVCFTTVCYAGTTQTKTNAFAMQVAAFRVSATNTDKKHFKPIADVAALPLGSLVYFQVTYKNQLAGVIASAKARIDIPKGLVLKDAAFTPQLVHASLDGVHFYPYPVHLKSHNGSKPAAMRKYQALQWQLTDIRDGESRTVGFYATKL